MPDNNKISVVIPAYNIAEYLPRCLDSILCQTHRNLEIIVINDGSSDGTGPLVDMYCKKDSRVRVIHKKNAGVSAARNDGLDAATGDYIGFVDGDDYLDRNMYGSLLELLLKFSADIAHCGYRKSFPDGRTSYYYNTGEIRVQDTNRGITDLLTADKIEPTLCTKLYKKAILKNLIQREDLKYQEDLLFNLEAFGRATVSVFYDITPYCYILRSGSATMQNVTLERIRDLSKSAEMIVEYFNNNPVILPYAKMKLIVTNVNSYKYILFRKPSDYRNILSTLRNELIPYKREIKSNPRISRNMRLFAGMIVSFPALFNLLYGLLNRFSKGKYKNIID